MVRDAGIEPASSRLKGECIAISANPAELNVDFGVSVACEAATELQGAVDRGIR
jgi:hypothetical protein